jgi:hypothetical protein
MLLDSRCAAGVPAGQAHTAADMLGRSTSSMTASTAPEWAICARNQRAPVPGGQGSRPVEMVVAVDSVTAPGTAGPIAPRTSHASRIP